MQTTTRFINAAVAAAGCLALTAALSLAPISGQTRPARAQQQQQTSASALIGTWGFTTISGTTYWDKSTGAYLGSGSGGSQSYTFAPGGTYKMFGSGSPCVELICWRHGHFGHTRFGADDHLPALCGRG